MPQLKKKLISTPQHACIETKPGAGTIQKNLSRIRYPIRYKKTSVDGIEIFYREAGLPNAPVLLLMHGFPSSSFMFRDLITNLKDRYYIIAPDYPGFGHSAVPPLEDFEYSFHNLSTVMERFIDSLDIKSFSMYIQDYGAPIGLRIVTRRPELLECLIVQNGNAYEQGLGAAWEPLKAIWDDPTNPRKRQQVMDFMNLDGTRLQYVVGTNDLTAISPDTYQLDQFLLERKGVKEIQLELLYDYRTNLDMYPRFQEMFRIKQPPTLVVWGENDIFFIKNGALAYANDIPNIQFQFYNTGHFALEECSDEIADAIDCFMQKWVSKKVTDKMK